MSWIRTNREAFVFILGFAFVVLTIMFFGALQLTGVKDPVPDAQQQVSASLAD
ncbi:MAG TPA: hypothetical protein VFK80_04980 [Limnochordia bacterium]|nr:hypothetical protein [Limnochordia bacterium]